jgi:stearoyl-CoA desaturase (delta-9 desaturase)
MLSNDTKVKIYQASIYVISIYAIVFYWDFNLFLISVTLGWLFYLVGGSVAMHKYAAHKTFQPKNRIVKILLIFLASITALGSTLSYSAQHRLHHKYSDLPNDPHNPRGNWYIKIKSWFFYFTLERIQIPPKLIKDLYFDKDHKFFYDHYNKIFIGFLLFMSLFGFKALAYVYAIPCAYCLFVMGAQVVAAHTPNLYNLFCWRTYHSKDYTVNSNFWSIIAPGEGYHNTHHACPGLWNNAINKGEFDLAAPIIKLIGIPNNVTIRKHPPIRKGYKLVARELKNVKEDIEKIYSQANYI